MNTTTSPNSEKSLASKVAGLEGNEYKNFVREGFVDQVIDFCKHHDLSNIHLQTLPGGQCITENMLYERGLKEDIVPVIDCIEQNGAILETAKKNLPPNARLSQGQWHSKKRKPKLAKKDRLTKVPNGDKSMLTEPFKALWADYCTAPTREMVVKTVSEMKSMSEKAPDTGLLYFVTFNVHGRGFTKAGLIKDLQSKNFKGDLSDATITTLFEELVRQGVKHRLISQYRYLGGDRWGTPMLTLGLVVGKSTYKPKVNSKDTVKEQKEARISKTNKTNKTNKTGSNGRTSKAKGQENDNIDAETKRAGRTKGARRKIHEQIVNLKKAMELLDKDELENAEAFAAEKGLFRSIYTQTARSKVLRRLDLGMTSDRIVAETGLSMAKVRGIKAHYNHPESWTKNRK